MKEDLSMVEVNSTLANLSLKILQNESISLDKVNSTLDDVSLKILKLMNEYIESKLKLQETIKSGCLDLAKARYIRGSHTITAVQLPTEDSIGVKALTTVLPADESTEDCLQFRLSCTEPSGPTKESNAIINNKKEDYIIEEETNLDASSKISDPLKWFGVLVPQNLRQAQTSFKRSIELVIDCVNIQSNIESNRQKFLSLRELKKALNKSEQ